MTRSALLIAMIVGMPAPMSWGDEPPAASRSARLAVTLPADAVLELQGVRMKPAGATRRFNIPLPDSGRAFPYRIRATWTEGEEPRVVERTITVRAGESVEVDLRADPASVDEQAVLKLTNAERKKAGLTPLVLSPELSQAARRHSNNMARRNQLAHTIGTEQFTDRIAATGYRAGEAGENIAMGAPTPAEAVSMWMRSPGHRANILNPRYRELGVGIGASAGGEKYYTQVFAVPAAR